MLISTTLSNHGYTPEEDKVYVRESLDRPRGLPGVRSASTMSNIPFLSGYYSEGFRHPSDSAASPSANMGINVVGPDFFSAMGIELMAGRGVDRTDVDFRQSVDG